jgi:beta-glucosidase
VRGFHGDDPSESERVLACAKHFAGYGFSDGWRDYDPVYLSETQLRNTALPPFKAAFETGVATFMSAYMDLNDIPASAHAGCCGRYCARSGALKVSWSAMPWRLGTW